MGETRRVGWKRERRDVVSSAKYFATPRRLTFPFLRVKPARGYSEARRDKVFDRENARAPRATSVALSDMEKRDVRRETFVTLARLSALLAYVFFFSLYTVNRKSGKVLKVLPTHPPPSSTLQAFHSSAFPGRGNCLPHSIMDSRASSPTVRRAATRYDR